MDDSKYVILKRLPSPQQYNDLRSVASLTPAPIEIVATGLANSWACFLVFERADMLNDTTPSPEQKPVGMGRLMGDGAMFLLLCDMAVHPDHQRRGLGKAMMQTLVDYCDEHAPHAYVSLVADPMGQGLYPKFGFEDVAPSLGMFRCERVRKVRQAQAAETGREGT
ncbi:acetyltransferase, GNAT family [Melanomma pulvis-pyrius CBS 109.77]|uniref:Acetyltransferase, GNAT family n=1 Tax=Melanomma pulvis-pyrius CBS 109.77 TaxID=1314802 RepID=A0A6A6XH22_9PLEO|nr:acetyltransferase, GNAT family [Melanomma pulvis-pyrius CBS 109.77]